jgi:hypothetical protein
MSSVTLPDIERLALLDRLDIKFILHEAQFLEILEQVRDQYQVLEVAGMRGGRYHTTYFDTADFALYNSHHNCERERFKVRWRHYVDSNALFLEFKEKTNRERTVKTRVCISEPIWQFTEPEPPLAVANWRRDMRELRPVVTNNFRRLMLADLDRHERITIDLGLEFGHEDRTLAYPGLAIVEVKQRKFSLASPIGHELHRHRIHPCHVSKYCVAMVRLYPELKQNRFKPLLAKLDRVCERGGGA